MLWHRDSKGKQVSTKLSKVLYEEIVKHQTDRSIRRTRPMQYPSGLYFNEKDLKKWIKKAKKVKKSEKSPLLLHEKGLD